MTQIDTLIQELIKFRDERDWQQFHNSKDLALAISIEASELNELFLWKNNEDVNKEKLKYELADTMAYCLLLAEKHGINIEQAIREKISLNAQKYPIEKSKGTATKYTEF